MKVSLRHLAFRKVESVPGKERSRRRRQKQDARSCCGEEGCCGEMKTGGNSNVYLMLRLIVSNIKLAGCRHKSWWKVPLSSPLELPSTLLHFSLTTARVNDLNGKLNPNPKGRTLGTKTGSRGIDNRSAKLFFVVCWHSDVESTELISSFRFWVS